MTLHHIRQKQISKMDLLQVMDAIRALTVQSHFSITIEMQIRAHGLFTRLEEIAPSPEVRDLARNHLNNLNKLMGVGVSSTPLPPAPSVP